ncbi:MAG: hypothetical protein ACI4QL_03465 [Candidatus Fimimonas sp.]
MRIKLRSGKTRLSFWFPLSVIKSRFVHKMIVGGVNRKKSVEPCSDSGEQREEQNDVEVSVKESEFCPVDEQEISCANAVAEQAAERNKEVAEQNAERSNAVAEQKMPFSNGEADFTIDREFLKKIYSALKTVVKIHGHFTLVDVCADNGDTVVKITV